MVVVRKEDGGRGEGEESWNEITHIDNYDAFLYHTQNENIILHFPQINAGSRDFPKPHR